MISCKATNGSGEMAQWLKLPAALPEHPSLPPSTHMVAHSHLYFQFQGTQRCGEKSLNEDSQLLDQTTDSNGDLRRVCEIYIL